MDELITKTLNCLYLTIAVCIVLLMSPVIVAYALMLDDDRG